MFLVKCRRAAAQTDEDSRGSTSHDSTGHKARGPELPWRGALGQRTQQRLLTLG